MKKCSKCNKEKDKGSFGKHAKKPDGLQTICKVCKKKIQDAWYQKNKKSHGETTRSRSREKVLENRTKLWEYYLENPCKCGERDPFVLECDHRDDTDKKGNISEMVGSGYAWATIKKEIAKCDVRCANCHRRRTAKVQGWYKHLRL